jgi:hypothetical protein
MHFEWIPYSKGRLSTVDLLIKIGCIAKEKKSIVSVLKSS